MPPQYQQSGGTTTMTAGRPPSPSTPISGRPQFRRQGSSYGPGHVHHMAVMVAPTRVDYSVNKGGIRTWVVLIVFVLLCSAILQIFSEEGGEERELTMVEDGVDAENEGGWKEEAKIGGSQKRPIISGQNNEDEEDDEEDEEDDENEEEEKDGTGKEEEGNEMDEQFEEKKSTKKMDEEEMMLARLREKAAKRWKERQQQQQQKIQQQQQEAMMNRGKIARERIRRRNAKRRIEDDDDEDEEDEEEEEQKLIQRQEVAHENADDEEDEEEQKREREEEHGILLDTEDEKDDDDRNEIAQQQHFMLKRNKIEPKTKKGGHVKSWRELRVQKDDGQKPRKELLRQQQRKLKYVADIDTKMPIEMEEDEENGEEKDEENEQISPATEIIALRKRPGYNRKAITNRGDYRFRQILDSGDYLLEKHEFDVAMQKYQQVLEHDPQSPRGLFGRARLHQLKSEFADEGEQWAKKEEWLEKAMTDYSAIMENEETPDELFRMAADHFVECARFRGGQQHKIVQIQRALLDRFPDNLDIQCQFGATWLGMNRPEEAAAIFKNVLEADPTNALGQAYYGFILKTHNGELEKGVQLLRRAIRSGHPDVRTNPKFYFHLGDGLTRLGRIQEAYSIYADAVKNGLFPSVLQRSVHNLKGLTARPWWALDQTECAKQLRQLERHWTAIKEEIVQLWNKKKHLFVRESGLDATLVDPTGGQWALVLRGNSHGAVLREEICDRWMPSTCELLKAFTNSICAREKIKLSVLGSGTSSWPHCGPTNYILEAHLGILTPSEARLRVGNEIRGWRQGKMFIFDTSFEREIIFDGAPANALRIALVLELWHPEMPQTLRGKIVEEREEEDDGK